MLKKKILQSAALLLTGAMCFAGDIRPERSKVQIALLLDTSNSMDGLIDQAKATLWDLVNEFTYVRCREATTPDLEIALYEYGNDGLDAREGFIRQVLPFSADLDAISERLFGLRTNGGEEYCGQAIQTAMKQLTWSRSPNDLRMVFIAGNEPFNQGEVPYASVLGDSAEKGVVVNTIFCGDHRLGVNTLWADGARLGKGAYSAIDHNRAIVQVATPYDDVIIRLNRDLNKTYIGYGHNGAAKQRMQMEQDANASAMNESVMVGRAISKSSEFYDSSGWDLVEAYAERVFKPEKLDREARAGLPAPLQELEAPELRQHLEKLKLDRARIQKEIREAAARRDAYLAEHQPAGEANLQQALLAAVRKQAEAKNYRWVKK